MPPIFSRHLCPNVSVVRDIEDDIPTRLKQISTYQYFRTSRPLQSLLFRLSGITVEDAERYPSLRIGGLREWLDYVGYAQRARFRQRSRPCRSCETVLRTKGVVPWMAQALGVPSVVPIFLKLSRRITYLTPSRTWQRFSDPLCPGEYFVKSAFGRWGEGSSVLIIDQSLSESGIYSTLPSMCEVERLEDGAYDGALRTLRILTWSGIPGTRRVVSVVVRRSTDIKSITDNWSTGGIAAEVGPDGSVGSWYTKDGQRITSVDSMSIERSVLGTAIKSALSAHELVPCLRSVGWDIGLSARGPLLIEGNDDWDVILPQVCEGVGLREIVKRDFCREWELCKES